MPYRAADGFSWESADYPIYARRVIAALILVLAGWATGFSAGGMSSGIFPVTQADTPAVSAADKAAARVPVVAQTNPEPPSPPVADKKQAATATPPAQHAAPAAGQSQPQRSRIER